MKHAGITTLFAVVAALVPAACGGATRTSVRTRTVTTTKTSAHTAHAAARSRTRTTSPNRASGPVFIAGRWTGTKPSEIDFSADAGNIVTKIHWASWRPTGAVGEGLSGILSCVPNCASGKTKYVPTAIALAAPSGGHFTHITEKRKGRSLSATYPSPPWPLSAS